MVRAAAAHPEKRQHEVVVGRGHEGDEGVAGCRLAASTRPPRARRRAPSAASGCGRLRSAAVGGRLRRPVARPAAALSMAADLPRVTRVHTRRQHGRGGRRVGGALPNGRWADARGVRAHARIQSKKRVREAAAHPEKRKNEVVVVRGHGGDEGGGCLPPAAQHAAATSTPERALSRRRRPSAAVGGGRRTAPVAGGAAASGALDGGRPAARHAGAHAPSARSRRA